MDFPNVSHVIQIGVPPDREQYIHRLGRTGRADKSGQGWLLLATVSSVAIGVPVRKDVTPSDANYTKLHEALQGVTVWSPNWGDVLKDLQADVARWRQATGS